MRALTVTARDINAWVVLELAGELDLHTAPLVREALGHLALGPARGLVVDLGGLTFCDSSGITCMIVARNHALGAQAGIALAAIPDRVSRIFSVVGLDEVFAIHPTAAEAVSALSES